MTSKSIKGREIEKQEVNSTKLITAIGPMFTRKVHVYVKIKWVGNSKNKIIYEKN